MEEIGIILGEIVEPEIGDAITDSRPTSGNIHDIIAENKELKDILRTILECDSDSELIKAVDKALIIINKPD